MNRSETRHPLQYWKSAPKPLTFGKSKPHRYVTFDIDQGGVNNIRLVFEYVVVIAAITGRTLVLPPARPWYLINFGPLEGGEPGGETHLADMFDLPALRKAIPILTAEEFIAEAAEHLGIPQIFWANARGQTDYKLGSFDAQWRDWLFRHTEVVAWNPYDSLICVPDVASLNENPVTSKHFPEHYIDGRTLVEFSPWMNSSVCLHFPSNDTHRSLGPVATMLAAVDTELPRMARRLLKCHLRYRPEIFHIALQLIDKLGYRKFNSLHVRRNDFQYQQTRLSAESILRNTAPVFDPKLPLYIATDETSGEFIDVFDKARKVFLWRDLLEASNLEEDIPPAWIGPIEQLICAAAKEFAGTDLSTFTAYIHRIRGYAQGPDIHCYYHSIDYHDTQLVNSNVEFRGRNYLQENPLFWLDC